MIEDYSASLMSAYIGNAISILLVAYLIKKDLKMTSSSIKSSNFIESMGIGMLASLINFAPLYVCFKLDKALTRREENNFITFS